MYVTVQAVELKDSSFDPDSTERIGLVKKPDSERPLYRVFLYLDGPDLPFVDRVTYELHPTFSSPTRTIERTPANPRCKLQIWTWGLFRVTATILNRSGQTQVLYHDLEYNREFSAPDAKFLAA